MRDAITTALEVAGMVLIAVAVALVTAPAVGFAVAGAAVFGVGVLEGRK